MNAGAAALALILALGVGCTGSPAPTPSPTTTIFPSPLPTRPSPVELPPIVLTADLDEDPPPWHPVAFVPFGEGHEELGYRPSRETPTVEPTSFAVAPDGSFWVIDAAKQRVVHVSRGGRFLEELLGVFGSGSYDLQFIGESLYIVSVHHRGVVIELTPSGDRKTHIVTENGRTVYVDFLVPTKQGVVAAIDGYTDPPVTGPIGIYGVDLPGSGLIEEVPGIPVGERGWLRIESPGDQDYDLHHISADGHMVQPVRFKVVADIPGGNEGLVAAVGGRSWVADDEDVWVYVPISASVPGGGGDQIGGRFLWRVGSSPMVFERLRNPTNVDDVQVRHIALGPDGRLYRMVIDREGIRIYQR